jgi:hypothetical protein
MQTGASLKQTTHQPSKDNIIVKDKLTKNRYITDISLQLLKECTVQSVWRRHKDNLVQAKHILKDHRGKAKSRLDKLLPSSFETLTNGWKKKQIHRSKAPPAQPKLFFLCILVTFYEDDISAFFQ